MMETDGSVPGTAGVAPPRDKERERNMDKPGQGTAAPMYTLAGVLPAAMRVVRLECKRCGREVNFVARQWRKSCSRCGLVITLPGALRAAQRQKEPGCFICCDRGLVLYQEQRGHLLYDYAARCTCPAGQRRRETGLPRVDEVDNIGSLGHLARQNRAAWETRIHAGDGV